MSTVVSLHPRGSTVVRTVLALARSRNNLPDAAAFAANTWGASNTVASVLRAAVSSGGFAPSSAWGQQLVDWTAASAEFWSIVQETSLIGRLTGLRKVPLNIRNVVMSTGATAGWVGQAKPIVVSGAVFGLDALPTRKVSALNVLSDELLRSSDPAAEPLIQADLARALRVQLDRSFIDPLNGGTPEVEPASILYGVTPTPAAATYALDIDNLLANFRGDLTRAVFIGSPQRFAAMTSADMRDVGLRGGELRGAPAYSSLQAGNVLALVDPSSIAIGTGVLTIDTSSEGTVEMSSSPVGGEVQQISLWQSNLTSVRCQQDANWQAIRANAVEFVQYA